MKPSQSCIVIALAAAAASAGQVRQRESFRIFFAGFYASPVAPARPDTIEAMGYDISSLLAKKRVALIALLQRARPVSGRPNVLSDMLVQDGGRKWSIWRSGEVQYGSKKMMLSKIDMDELKSLVYVSLPNDIMGWWQRKE